MLKDLTSKPVGAVITAEPLVHNTGNQATGGIWRVCGTAGSAILKHATAAGDGNAAWAASDEPHHWNYWRREYLAYLSGFTARYGMDTGLTAPRLLDIAQRRDGSVELWIEDVAGRPGTEWGLSQLGEFCRRLGVVQARWRGHGEDHSWLSRDWLRQYTAKFATTDPVEWDHPLVAKWWPQPLRHGLKALWDNRESLAALAHRLPRTVCHLDVWPMNLMSRGDDMVLFDWAFTGDGAIGEDIANLIPDTVADGLMPNRLLPAITEAAIHSYRDGLREGATASPIRSCAARWRPVVRPSIRGWDR
jgi:hypothetical protein